jgi:hypothetical protein
MYSMTGRSTDPFAGVMLTNTFRPSTSGNRDPAKSFAMGVAILGANRVRAVRRGRFPERTQQMNLARLQSASFRITLNSLGNCNEYARSKNVALIN